MFFCYKCETLGKIRKILGGLPDNLSEVNIHNYYQTPASEEDIVGVDFFIFTPMYKEVSLLQCGLMSAQ